MASRLPGGTTVTQAAVDPAASESSPDGRPGIERARSWPGRLAQGLIGLYKRFLSPLLPPMCRFEPTCSQYAAQAIGRYGLLRGGWLAVRRLLRCNPMFPGGHDPVP